MDNGDFTPMVFSSCGGAGPQAMIALKKLAEAIAVKRARMMDERNWDLNCRNQVGSIASQYLRAFR